MSKVFIEDTEIQSIAEAIREKNGASTKYLPSEMSGAIRNITGGGGTSHLDGYVEKFSIAKALIGNKEVITEDDRDNSTDWNIVYFPNATTIEYEGIARCNSLTEVYLPKVTTVGEYGLYANKSLRVLDLPQATNVGIGAFSSCDALETMDLPKVTSMGRIAFNDCTSLTTVNLPLLTFLSDFAFESCTSLTTVNLPNVTEIDAQAFQNCSSLTLIDLPKATSVGVGVFMGCVNLKALILRSDTICNLNITALVSTNILSGEGMPTGMGFVYVPTALLESYITNMIPQIMAIAEQLGMSIDEPTATYIASTIFRGLESYTVDGTVTGELDGTKI